MAFCLVLAGLSAYVQISERKIPADVVKEIETLKADLRNCEDKLLGIEATAAPISFARADIMGGLPPGPERDTLQTLLNALSEILLQ